MEMTEQELIKIVRDMAAKSTGAERDSFMVANADLWDRYNAAPYGDEEEGSSKVISTDVYDAVEAYMPSLVRTFLGPGDVMTFQPSRMTPDAIQEAEEKSQYVNWLVQRQPYSFSVIHDWIKEALVQKLAVVKYMMTECEEVEEHTFTGISDDELAVIEESLQGEDVQSIEIVRQDDEHTVTFSVKKLRKIIDIINVPLESFRITPNSRAKDDAEMVGDVECVTRGELVARGYTRATVEKIPLAGRANKRLTNIRDDKELNAYMLSSDWAAEEIESWTPTRS